MVVGECGEERGGGVWVRGGSVEGGGGEAKKLDWWANEERPMIIYLVGWVRRGESCITAPLSI